MLYVTPIKIKMKTKHISHLILIGEVSGENVWHLVLEVDELRRGVDAVTRGVLGVVDLDQDNSVPAHRNNDNDNHRLRDWILSSRNL